MKLKIRKFTEGARAIAQGNSKFACNTLGNSFTWHTLEVKFYRNCFSPDPDRIYWAFYGQETVEENQLARTLSLLFAAELAKEANNEKK